MWLTFSNTCNSPPFLTTEKELSLRRQKIKIKIKMNEMWNTLKYLDMPSLVSLWNLKETKIL